MVGSDENILNLKSDNMKLFKGCIVCQQAEKASKLVVHVKLLHLAQLNDMYHIHMWDINRI